MTALTDLCAALSTGPYAIRLRLDADGKWVVNAIDAQGTKPAGAPGVAGYAELLPTLVALVAQLDEAHLPGRVHRALDTWRRRHDPSEAP